MLQKIVDFLMTDKVLESKNLQKYRTKFVYTIGSFLVFLLISMSIFRFLKGNYLVSVVDLCVGLSLFLMIFLLERNKKLLSFITQIYIILFFLFTFFLILSVEYEIKIVLPYLFITAAIFLKGKKIGFLWLIIVILTIVVLSVVPQINFPYHGLTTVMMIMLLVSQYMILILYANQQEENILNLYNSNSRVQESLYGLKVMLDSTIMAIIVHGQDGIRECNKVSMEMFGYSEKEFLGKSVLSFVHSDDHELVKSKMALSISEPYEIRVLGKDRVIPVLIGGTNLILNGEKVRVASMFDLSEFKQKDSLLQQQSRQAAMGEMIGNIAHQWRQPLNALGLVLQNIYFEHQMGTVDDLFMERSVDKGKRLIQTMSKTIDDFRNFFKPNKLKERFNISEVINTMVDLIGASYQNNGIALELALDDSLEIEGYSGEFSQVILNIMSNAKDAFIENSIVDKKVIISSHRESNNIIIEISDNAGGIPKDIIQKIFDPYFSTKEEGKGTGIGLYMSKTIIETNMRGKLSVKNINQGVIFKITLQENLDY